MPFSPRGIEQSLVLPPRWPLILYTGTLYTFISIGKLSISKYRYGKYPHLISVLHLELQIRNLL